MPNRPYLSTARGQILSNPLTNPNIARTGGGGGGGGGGGVPDVTDKCIIHIYIILLERTVLFRIGRDKKVIYMSNKQYIIIPVVFAACQFCCAC